MCAPRKTKPSSEGSTPGKLIPLDGDEDGDVEMKEARKKIVLAKRGIDDHRWRVLQSTMFVNGKGKGKGRGKGKRKKKAKKKRKKVVKKKRGRGRPKKTTSDDNETESEESEGESESQSEEENTEYKIDRSLYDGDIIGVKVCSEDSEDNDDFTTSYDEYIRRKKESKREREQEPNRDLKIDLTEEKEKEEVEEKETGEGMEREKEGEVREGANCTRSV